MYTFHADAHVGLKIFPGSFNPERYISNGKYSQRRKENNQRLYLLHKLLDFQGDCTDFIGL
jgi:hypothetical protein